MEALEKKLVRGSYFDLIDVEHRANSLVIGCKKLLVQVARDLADSIGKERSRLKKLQEFWQEYYYKPFFGVFAETMATTAVLLNKAEHLLDRNESGSFKEAVGLHKEAGTAIDQLNGKIDRMLWIQSLMDGIKKFGKRLLLTETVLLVLAATLMQGGQSFFSSGSGSLARLFSEPRAFNQVLYLTGLFLAPTIALMTTIWSLREKK